MLIGAVHIYIEVQPAPASQDLHTCFELYLIDLDVQAEASAASHANIAVIASEDVVLPCQHTCMHHVVDVQCSNCKKSLHLRRSWQLRAADSFYRNLL